VKPLEWVDRIVDDEDGGTDVAGSAAQTAYPQQYWTSLHHEEDGKWRLYFGLSIIGRFGTEDAAKAAAQADYEVRIRSALTSPASGERDTPAGYVLVPVDPTEGMLEAGMDSLAQSTGEPLSFIVRDVLFAYRAMVAAYLAKASGERDAWAGSAPFITSESGGGEYAVRVKVHSMDELHAAHTIVLKAFGAKL
jgi:hypothetical protein